jgi:hypothetical protein
MTGPHISDETIADVKRLDGLATKGPWQQDGSHIYGPDPQRLIVCQMHYIGRGYQEESAANEELIKLARTVLPEAVREIRRLREENKRLRELVNGAGQESDSYQEFKHGTSERR